MLPLSILQLIDAFKLSFIDNNESICNLINKYLFYINYIFFNQQYLY